MVATIGQRIEEIRKDKGLSQEELAEGVGISRSLLSMIEIDKRMPPLDILKRLADKLSVSPYYLFSGTEDENYLVCEQTGLSNNTINMLKRQFLYYPQNEMVKLFDLIANYPELVSYLYQYLTLDFRKPKVLLGEDEYKKALENRTDFSELYATPSETWDKVLLLSVEKILSSVKDKIMKERAKESEKGKR